MKTPLFLPLCLMSICLPMISCKEKTPAERTGEKIDKGVEKIKDAVDPKGPAEKAGEKIDKTLGK